jgi:hypothetical protein
MTRITIKFDHFLCKIFQFLGVAVLFFHITHCQQSVNKGININYVAKANLKFLSVSNKINYFVFFMEMLKPLPTPHINQTQKGLVFFIMIPNII